MSNHKLKNVKHPRTQVLDNDTALLAFEYDFEGTELHIELRVTRDMIDMMLQRMDDFDAK